MVEEGEEGRDGEKEGGRTRKGGREDEKGREGGREIPMLAVHFLKLGQVDLVALGEERVETLMGREGEKGGG